MRLKVVTAGILLVCMAFSSMALTLGRARGAAWIGQTLEIVIPVQLDAGQTATALCAEADVFHADSRQDASRIQVLVEPTAQADTVNLRVQSSALVDEPVVTVYLRAGCNQKTTRRYVLLADFPSETQAPALRAVAEPVAPSVPLAAPEAAASPAPPPSAGPSASAATKAATNSASAPKPAVRKEVAVAPPKPAAPKPPPAEHVVSAAATPAPAKPAPYAGRSRLKLDPLESLAERIKTLETTTTAVPLEDMVKDSQRIQQLQNDMKALLDQASKNEASLVAMRERLEKAEAERVPVALVYGLVALVLLCLAAIAVLWNRRADPSAWRAGLPTGDAETIQQESLPSALPPQAPAPARPRTAADTPVFTTLPTKEAAPTMDVDVNLMDLDEESFVQLLKPQPTNPSPLITEPPSAFAQLGEDAAHPDFNSESMFDLRQQAEFFVKLGKLDEAIEALEKRIRENGKDSPWIYLELLRIANAHSLKTDFRQFREELVEAFNVDVPEFALFRNEGRGLEAYPSLLTHICSLWPSPKVLDVIEACVLRDPHGKNAEAFDVAAFKDLVVLHGIAHALAFPQESRTVALAEDDNTQHVDLDF